MASGEIPQRRLLNGVERGAESSACSVTVRVVRPVHPAVKRGTKVVKISEK